MRRFLRLSVGRRGVEQAVDEELAFHLDMRVAELERAGVPRESAMRQARAEFGDIRAARSELAAIDLRRQARTARAEWLRDLLFDARLALRSYARQPGFTLVVVLTLGLGIGANTAIFSIVNSVLLRPLPFARPEQLVHLWETRRGDAADLTEASYPDFEDWRAENSVFSALEAYDPTNVTVATPEGGDMVSGARVTSGFFRMLGVPPALGRTFDAGDDGPGGSSAVVISHAFFERRFGGDARVIGRTVVINGVAHDIRGVMPDRFTFAPAGEIDVWLPLGRTDTVRAERFNHWVNAVGRLRDGVTVTAARRRMDMVMARLARDYPQSNDGRGMLVVPLREVYSASIERPLLVLFGAVVIVLLIACANVASLMLARSIERANEMALRSAIGASRARIVRELLTENLVLAVAGALLGGVLAVAGIRLLVSAIPAGMVDQGTAARATLDLSALAFTAGVAVVTGLLFGLAPAALASRASPASLLRSDSRVGAARSRHRVRDTLVAAEIALTLVLIVGAALMGRSVLALLRLDPGFNATSVVTVRVALAGPRYDVAARQPAFFEQLLARARAIPGVQEAGAISSPPLQGGGTNTFRVEGVAEPPPAQRPEATTRAVAGDYFRALRIPIVEGRALNEHDDLRSYYAAVISESLARRLFGAQSAVGRRLRFYAWEDSAWTIVGVVGDVKTDALDKPAAPTIYYSHLQGPANRMSLMVRASIADPASLIPVLRREVATLDPAVAVYAAGTLIDRTASSTAVYSRRYLVILLGAFAAAALLLAVIGVYGVIAYSVSQRSRELCIRAALGATRGSIVMLVMRHAAYLAVAGIAIGAAVAVALSRSVSSLLFGVSATDAGTYVVTAFLLLLVSAAASYLPARKATRVDPAHALRSS